MTRVSALRAWRWLAVPLLVIPVAWLLFAGIGKDPRDIRSPLIGRPLPQISATTLTDTPFSTADLAGRPAIVNVWASWCTPCAEEHPLLLDLAAAHPDDLQIVGITYQDATDASAAFLARHGDGGWPNAVDADGRIAVELGVTGPPETFFVDGAGIVRYRHVGPLTQDVLDEQLPAIGVTP